MLYNFNLEDIDLEIVGRPPSEDGKQAVDIQVCVEFIYSFTQPFMYYLCISCFLMSSVKPRTFPLLLEAFGYFKAHRH